MKDRYVFSLDKDLLDKIVLEQTPPKEEEDPNADVAATPEEAMAQANNMEDPAADPAADAGADPSMDPNADPAAAGMAGGDPSMDPAMGGMPGEEPAKDPTEIGRVFELKKIYSRLLAIETYLSDSADLELIKIRKYVSQASTLFGTLIDNLDSYKDNLDNIVVMFYKFLEEVYQVMDEYYAKKDQEEQAELKKADKKSKKEREEDKDMKAKTDTFQATGLAEGNIVNKKAVYNAMMAQLARKLSDCKDDACRKRYSNSIQHLKKGNFYFDKSGNIHIKASNIKEQIERVIKLTEDEILKSPDKEEFLNIRLAKLEASLKETN